MDCRWGCSKWYQPETNRQTVLFTRNLNEPLPKYLSLVYLIFNLVPSLTNNLWLSTPPVNDEIYIFYSFVFSSNFFISVFMKCLCQ